MPEIKLPTALAAAIFVLARKVVPHWDGWPPSVAEMLDIVGDVGRSQCYEHLNRLREVLPSLLGTPGRPPSSSAGHIRAQVVETVLAFILEHPGSVCGTGSRRTYSDDFRRFVVGLTEPGQAGASMSVAELASACQVPLGTLKDWLRLPVAVKPAPASEPAGGDILDTIQVAHLRTIVSLWLSWEGTFQAFCRMARTEHRLPYGDTYIGNFLQAAGLRVRRRRPPGEAPWCRNSFRRLFPGAQWLGDGTTIAIYWRDRHFIFNVEALLDVASNGVVGFTVSNAEDEAALRAAYEAGKETAGGRPLAVTLDNKPCNHSPGAAQAVQDAILLRATPGRGQAKAPLEGAFGLFQQSLPPLVVQGATQREMARCVLDLVLTAWFRGRNGRPRAGLGGRTPADVYTSACPTPEEVEEAQKWFRQLHNRQERARLTKEARRDPVRIQLLTEGLAQLGIPDPDQSLARSLAGFSREAIARGLATFQSKQKHDTLPPDVEPARYLGGIIRQLDTRMELEELSVRLLEQRIRLRDLTLAPLHRQAEKLRAVHPTDRLPQAYVDQALHATYLVDFRFWKRSASEALQALPAPQRMVLYEPLTRRVAASFKTDRERRADLIECLAQATASAA